MLSALLGVRWAVGKWEKEKNAWWGDWKRIGDGLGRDLKAALDDAMRDNVVVAPEAASNGLIEMVKARKGEVEEVKDGLDTLWDEFEKVGGKK